MNSSRLVCFAAILAPWYLYHSSPVSGAEVIVLQSGFDEVNSVPWNVGQPDVGLTYITTGSGVVGFANAFTAADFVAAQSGPSAFTMAALVVGNQQVYIPSLFAPYPQAQWVNIVPNPLVPQTMLYAMPFQVTTANITSASLSVKWAVDDLLGDPAGFGPNPVGVYLNGQPVPSAISGGDKFLLTTMSDPNVGPLLQTGQNWLYIYQRDNGGGASGVMFGATITIVPEPASLLVALVLAGGAFGAHRSRNAAGPRRSRSQRAAG